MATRNTDVNLIIRARTEGEKAVEALANMVAALGGDASKASGGVADLGKNLSALEKLFGSISGTANDAAQAFDRQTAALDKAKGELRGVAQEAVEYQRNIEAVRQGIVSGVLAGTDVSGLRDLLVDLSGEMGKLDSKSTQLTRTIDRLESGVDGARSSLQLLGSTVNAVEAVQATARSRIEATTAAINQQAAASENAQRLLNTINRANAPVLFNGPATSNGATTDALIRQFQQLESEAKAVRASLDPLTAAVERYEERVARLQQLVAGGHLGAEEMAAQERELTAALKDTLQQIGYVDAAEQDRVRKGVTALEALTRAERAYANTLAERANIEAALERSTGTGKLAATDLGASYSALAERERLLAERRRQLEQGEASVQQAAIARSEGSDRPSATAAGATFSALDARAAEQEGQALRDAALAFNRFEAAAREGAAALRQNEAAAEADAKLLGRIRDALDPAAAAQRNLNQALDEFRAAAARSKLSAKEIADGESLIKKEADDAAAALKRRGTGPNSGVGAFGLKPYELQNLGYQVNDVVTQLASGTSLSQTLGQQGGQILQLFPRVGSAIVGALTNPAIVGFASIVGGVIVVLNEAANEAERLRDITASISLTANGGIYDAAKLNTSTLALRAYGISAKEATDAAKQFVGTGLPQEQFERFAVTAKNVSRATGTDFKDAFATMVESFGHGAQAALTLDDKLHFLSNTQRQSVIDFEKQGRSADAVRVAFDAYSARASKAASDQAGPWKASIDGLSGAYNSFIETLANTTIIQGALSVLERLAEIADRVARNMKAATNATEILAAIDAVNAAKADVEAARARGDKKAEQEALDRNYAAKARELRLQGDPNYYNLGFDKLEAPAKPRGPSAQDLAANRAMTEEEQRQTVETLKRQRVNTANVSIKERDLRLSLAGLEAARRFDQQFGQAGDQAQRQRLLANAQRVEQAEIQKENLAAQKAREAAAKQALADRDHQLKQFEDRVIGAEGGAGKNPFSSAKGYGQFTEGTWLAYVKKVVPQSSDLPRDQLLAFRQNEQVARGVIDAYARENAKFLESFGAKVTAGNLYLAHFLGPAGAKAVLTAPSDKPVDSILSGKVLSGNQGYLRTDGGKGRYRTAGELQTFIGNRVGDKGAPQVQAQIALTKAIEESVDRQENFNLAVQHGNEDRARSIDGLTKESGLMDAALLAEQRRQAVAQAVLDLRQKAEDTNKNLKPGETPVVVSQEQIASVEQLTGALFDAQHAKELLAAPSNDLNRTLEAFQQQRELLVQRRELLTSIGEFRGAEKVQSQIDAIDGQIQTVYQKLIDFYRALSPEQAATLGFTEQQLENVVGKMEQAKDRAVDLNRELLKGSGVTYKGFLDAFSGAAANAFTNFIKNVAQGKNVFKSLGNAIKEFAGELALSLAQSIIRILAFTAALYALSALTGIPVQVLAAAANATASVHHDGGIVGQASTKRTVNPMIFATAARYHDGGIIGLKPNEVPAILERQEEVLTTSDPRHRFNAGKGGGVAPAAGPTPVNIVNTFSPEEAAEQILRTRAGEKAILNVVTQNKSAFKAALT